MTLLPIDTPFITLQQALKLAGLVPSGGSVKMIIQDEHIMINGERETRRGRKLYPGDVIHWGKQAVCISEGVAGHAH